MADNFVVNKRVHQPVLLEPVLSALNIQPDGIYIDATFGRGGHSQEILARLNEKGRLCVIDRDSAAIESARMQFGEDKRVIIHHGPFTVLADLAKTHEMTGKVNGILFDLGVSSPQLDEAERGFSFLRNGPLDMRMDTGSGMDAATWINQSSVEEMAAVFKEYGEERYAKRIARAIAEARIQTPITTTHVLADIVSKAHPRWEKHKHPATRVFQAIRIFINDEMNLLRRSLEETMDVLKVGGRLVVVSFHSLEDRIVKRFMRKHSQGHAFPAEIPIVRDELGIRLHVLGKAMKPEDSEIQRNPRARSAVLRVAEKVA